LPPSVETLEELEELEELEGEGVPGLRVVGSHIRGLSIPFQPDVRD